MSFGLIGFFGLYFSSGYYAGFGEVEGKNTRGQCGVGCIARLKESCSRV